MGWLRNVIPNWMIRLAKTTEKELLRASKKYTSVENHSKYTNIYHFALQKTGTQWTFDLLSDPVVYKYSGMTTEKFNAPRRKSQSHPVKLGNKKYKKNKIITGIGGTYENYIKDIPKNDNKNAVFFVVRDPREMIVSWYFSTKENHLVDSASMMAVHRKRLNNINKKSGIKYTIDLFDWKGKFDVMRSWMNKGKKENIKIINFEKMVSERENKLNELFDFLDIKIPKCKIKKMARDYSFENLTGRKKGEEDKSSHMRSGGKKTWEKHISQYNYDYMMDLAGDIVKEYEYEDNSSE